MRTILERSLKNFPNRLRLLNSMIWYAIEICFNSFDLDSEQTKEVLAAKFADIFVPWLGLYKHEYFNVLPGYVLVLAEHKPFIRMKGFTGESVACTEEDFLNIKEEYYRTAKETSFNADFCVRNPEEFSGLRVRCFIKQGTDLCMLSLLESRTLFFIGQSCSFYKAGGNE